MSYNPEIDHGYFTDSCGNVVVTISELEKSDEHSNFIDSMFFRSYYTKNIDNLDENHIKCVIDNAPHLMKDVLEANNYDYVGYLIANFFNDLEFYFSEDTSDYIETYYYTSDCEPEEEEEDYFFFNGKYYTEK